MKESIEVRSPNTRSLKPRRVRTNDDKRTTRKTTSKTTNSNPKKREGVLNVSQNLKKKRSSQY